ncbi:hypothetical protein Q3G72_032297 [Acer saccharum]|nr:hypothetical protein Q3G72_032297 [Acer saccharum]
MLSGRRGQGMFRRIKEETGRNLRDSSVDTGDNLGGGIEGVVTNKEGKTAVKGVLISPSDGPSPCSPFIFGSSSGKEPIGGLGKLTGSQFSKSPRLTLVESGSQRSDLMVIKEVGKHEVDSVKDSIGLIDYGETVRKNSGNHGKRVNQWKRAAMKIPMENPDTIQEVAWGKRKESVDSDSFTDGTEKLKVPYYSSSSDYQ